MVIPETMDPIITKIVVGLISVSITTVLGIVGYFLKKNFDSIDKLSDMIHAMKEELIVHREDNKSLKDEVYDLSDRVKAVEKDVHNIKLDVRENTVTLGIKSRK